MGYNINYNNLSDFELNAMKKIEEWSVELSAILTNVDEFINSQAYTGISAERIKNYLSNINYSITFVLMEVIMEYSTKLLLYVNGLKEIDRSDSANLNEDALTKVVNQFQYVEHEIAESYGRVSDLMNQISDILPPNLEGLSNYISPLDSECSVIQSFQNQIREYEDASEADLSEIRNHVEELLSIITNIESIEIGDITDVHAINIMSKSKKDTLQCIKDESGQYLIDNFDKIETVQSNSTLVRQERNQNISKRIAEYAKYVYIASPSIIVGPLLIENVLFLGMGGAFIGIPFAGLGYELGKTLYVYKGEDSVIIRSIHNTFSNIVSNSTLSFLDFAETTTPEYVSAEHYIINKISWEEYVKNYLESEKYIEHQNKLEEMLYGVDSGSSVDEIRDALFMDGDRMTAVGNTCEVIAMYNAVVALNNGDVSVGMDFPDLLRICEQNGIIFHGYFGTDPENISEYFNELEGYEAEMISGSDVSVSSADNCIAYIQDNYDTYILTAYNDKDDVSQTLNNISNGDIKNVPNEWGGIHTVCITKEENGYVIHNKGYSDDDEKEYSTLEEAVNGFNEGNGRPISLIGIRKESNGEEQE